MPDTPDHAHPHDSSLGQGRSLGGYSDAFADDDGAAPEAVRRALAGTRQDGSPQTYLAAVAELCLSRLLVPLVATGDETMQHDPERQAAMSAVMLQAADGRRAMLAFTGMDALTAWDPKARPVPATLDTVAESAASSGCGTVLIDLQGPAPLEIEGVVLEQLALGRRLSRLEDGSFGWLVLGE
ncbi:SseB family protein [Mariniluteicoccus flavus]